MSDGNKEIVRRLREEGVSTGNSDVFDECLAPDFLYHGPLLMEELQGRDAFKQAVAGFRMALPDLRETIEYQIAEGDRVSSLFTGRGTHTGSELFGVAPTGKQVIIKAMDITRYENGKIVEMWAMFDVHGMMQQVGAFPEPE